MEKNEEIEQEVNEIIDVDMFEYIAKSEYGYIISLAWYEDRKELTKKVKALKKVFRKHFDCVSVLHKTITKYKQTKALVEALTI